MNGQEKITVEPDMRERVDKLRKTDHPYENSVKVLAEKENNYRDEELKKIKEKLEELGADEKIIKELIDNAANKFSDESLGNIEKEKTGMIDKLTGIGNRKFVDEMIPKFLNFEKRESQDCSVIMLDIDNFKDINDKYGHQKGDEVLQSVVKTIKKSVREYDFVLRYGGEEFIIFCPNTNFDQVQEVAERIRSAIEKKGIMNRTVSLGYISTSKIPTWGKEQKDGDIDFEAVKHELIEKADRALYHSKNTGKNKATAYKKGLSEKPTSEKE